MANAMEFQERQERLKMWGPEIRHTGGANGRAFAKEIGAIFSTLSCRNLHCAHEFDVEVS